MVRGVAGAAGVSCADAGRGARRLRRASGLGHRAHTRTSARISSSLKPPSCMAPEGQSAAQIPQPRQTFGSTSAWASAPAVSVTATCGQALSQTPQPMQTAASDEATWAGVSTKPLESIETARAAAALAWAIESGMSWVPGPCRTGTSGALGVDRGELGMVFLDEAGGGGLQAGDLGDLPGAVRGFEAGRKHDQVEQLLVLASGHGVLEAHAQALVGLFDDLADAAPHVAHAAALHEPVVLLVALARRAHVGVADGDLRVGVVLLEQRGVQRGEQAADRPSSARCRWSGSPRADALEHEDLLRHGAVGGPVDLAFGRPGGGQQAGELALGQDVAVAAEAERRLAAGVELLVAGGDDHRADRDLLVPLTLVQVDGARRTGAHAGTAVRADGAGQAAPASATASSAS